MLSKLFYKVHIYGNRRLSNKTYMSPIPWKMMRNTAHSPHPPFSMLNYDEFPRLDAKQLPSQHWKGGPGGGLWNLSFNCVRFFSHFHVKIWKFWQQFCRLVSEHVYPRTLQKMMQMTLNFQWSKISVNVKLHDSLEKLLYDDVIIFRTSRNIPAYCHYYLYMAILMHKVHLAP